MRETKEEEANFSCVPNTMFPFHLVLTSGPILGGYWFLSVCYIRVFAKKIWAIPIMNPVLWFMMMKTTFMV